MGQTMEHSANKPLLPTLWGKPWNIRQTTRWYQHYGANHGTFGKQAVATNTMGQTMEHSANKPLVPTLWGKPWNIRQTSRWPNDAIHAKQNLTNPLFSCNLLARCKLF